MHASCGVHADPRHAAATSRAAASSSHSILTQAKLRASHEQLAACVAVSVAVIRHIAEVDVV